MITNRTIEVRIPTDLTAAAKRAARAADPIALAAAIAAVDVAALYERLALYKRNRVAAEAAVAS